MKKNIVWIAIWCLSEVAPSKNLFEYEVGRVLTKAADQSRRRYFYAQPRTSYLTELADKPIASLASFAILLFA